MADENTKELVTKVKALIDQKFGGDYRKAWGHYDKLSKKDDMLDGNELKELLSDANVGTWATRGLWVDGVMEKGDTDKDGRLSWREFEVLIKK